MRPHTRGNLRLGIWNELQLFAPAYRHRPSDEDLRVDSVIARNWTTPSESTLARWSSGMKRSTRRYVSFLPTSLDREENLPLIFSFKRNWRQLVDIFLSLACDYSSFPLALTSQINLWHVNQFICSLNKKRQQEIVWMFYYYRESTVAKYLYIFTWKCFNKIFIKICVLLTSEIEITLKIQSILFDTLKKNVYILFAINDCELVIRNVAS